MIKRLIYLRQQVYVYIGISLILFCAVKCSSTIPDKTSTILLEKKEASIKNLDTIIPSPHPINYQLISVLDSVKWLQSLSVGDTLSAILVLNRVDQHNLLKLDSFIVPDTIAKGIDLYSPFPQKVKTFENLSKILIISYYVQAFAAYENGVRVKWGPVSLGKEATPTPTGLFATNWKSKRTISSINSDWVMDWYFNIENFQGVSLHQYALPGHPASHACIRLYQDDAYWFYYWADQWILELKQISAYGTPVVIYGNYPYGKRKPWLISASNNEALKISSSELTDVTKDFLPTIYKRQFKRDSVINYNQPEIQ